MVICKKCNREIDELEYTSIKSSIGTFFIEDGVTLYDDEDIMDDEIAFFCPKCDATLATSEKEAKKILKGRK